MFKKPKTMGIWIRIMKAIFQANLSKCNKTTEFQLPKISRKKAYIFFIFLMNSAISFTPCDDLPNS
jgi:hypothetical protein